MQVPLSWLKEFVTIDMPVEALAQRLTSAGLEVAKLHYIGLPQQEVPGTRYPKSAHLVWERDKILLGAIREVKPHPDADRLVLALVDYGGAELEQCVTGAPNLYEYKHRGPLPEPLWAPFALEGATVWDGHSDEPKLMKLQGKKLRGIYNKSMVCSEKELGISEEHEGILILDPEPHFRPGLPLQDVLGDVVLEIELTPNLGHAFSILGVAREIAAMTGQPLRQPSYDFVADGAPIVGQAAIEIHTPELNPRFTLTLLRNTRVQPSPGWMQRRLRLAGQRPINNIVDVTNYITFELGQPLHAFDYDKLVARAGGQPPTIITRLPQPNETLETLDGVKRALSENQILVCDTAGVLSLGGIIGGAETEISDDTTNVLLEAANWNFINIRRTMQAQKVHTEAGARFSRNIHPSRAILGCQRGIELMRQTGGGQIAAGVIDEYPLPPTPSQVSLSAAHIERLLGMPVSAQAAADALQRLGFAVRVDGDTLHVTTPDYRTDIGEGVIGQADVIEEIARVIGLDELPSTIMADEMPQQRSNTRFEREEALRDLLVSLGLYENISYRFTTPQAEARLTPPGAVSSLPQADYVALANPIASDKTVLRHSLLTALLETTARNTRYQQRQQVFEIGSVYLKHGPGLPEEAPRLAIIMTGLRHVPGWANDENAGSFDFYDLKGVIEAILVGLHIRSAAYERSQHSSFHPGRSAELRINGVSIGSFGELHPLVARAFDLEGQVVLVAELDLHRLFDQAPDRHAVRPLPITPAILEDLALVVSEETPAAAVEALIRKSGGDLLKDLRLFDVYRGPSIAPGHKSLAYSLTYQTDEKTLKDKDVEKIRRRIIATAERELNAKLRA